MDVNNPWQVVSIEAFYCLKCPECMYFTTDDNQFYNHAVENHPLSGVLFGKPKDETIDREEILNLVVVPTYIHLRCQVILCFVSIIISASTRISGIQFF